MRVLIQKLKQHEEKVMKMIEKQNEERKQIQAKMSELNASTNIQGIKTVYQSSIDEVRERINQRKEIAEEIRRANLEKFGGGSGEDEDEAGSDEEGKKDGGNRDSLPAVDMRKKRSEKEADEFKPYLDLKLNEKDKNEEDMREFKKISKYWDNQKINRFHNLRHKHQVREFERKNGLARDDDKKSGKLPKYKPVSAPQQWMSDSSMYPKPVTVGKDGKPVFNKEELENWKKEQAELQAKIQSRREALKKKDLTPQEEKKIQEERKKKYENMIKDMRKE